MTTADLFPVAIARWLSPDPDEPDDICDRCGHEASELDALGRCDRALCALASRIDEEVPLRAIRATMRISRLAFARRVAS